MRTLRPNIAGSFLRPRKMRLRKNGLPFAMAGIIAKAIDHIDDNWQGTWLLKLARFGTNTALHFFNTIISRAEGAHALIKQELNVSTGDLLTVQRISSMLIRQEAQYKQRIDDGMFNEKRQTLSRPIFGLVKGIISSWALPEVCKQKEAIGQDMQLCRDIYTTISGLPCKHAILRRLNSDNPRLRPEDFHPYWFYNYTNHPGPQQLPALYHIQEPDMNTRHIKYKGAPASAQFIYIARSHIGGA